MKEIDARGLACPTPVLLTKSAVEEDKAIALTVVVDNPASQQNVVRFLESKGYSTAASQNGQDYLVTGQVGEAPVAESRPTSSEGAVSDQQKIMVMCASDRIGSGDDELGQKLMVNFIKTLAEMDKELWRLVFVNSGVKLTVTGSELVPVLRGYEESGLTILVCGTCLTHFNLLERKEVGETTNMLDIVTAMQLADKVINL